MTLKQFLRQAFDIDNLIRADEEQIQRLKDKQTNISSALTPDKVQTSRSTDPMGDATVALMALMDVYAKDILRQTMLQVKIQEMINCLEDTRQQVVMTERYINLKQWEDVALDNHYSESTVYSVHGAALQVLQKKFGVNWS